MGGGGRHMDRQVSLWERRTETAGWLGLRVRHNARQLEGIHPLGVRLLLVPGAAAVLGVKW